MPGTGKGMYTGALSSPSYAYTTGGARIVDSSGGSPYGSTNAGPGNSINTTTHSLSLDPNVGDYSMGGYLAEIIAQLAAPTPNTVSNNISPVTNVNLPDASPIIKELAKTQANGYNALGNSITSFGNSLASAIKEYASASNTDYSDYMRELLDISKANSAQSQANAREQMEYQKASDQAAMAWSAAEAEKNRKWQEKMSNTAHQREMKDLLKAGLNPILAANQGAYTGSGATGQGFSSSGAQGSVDTSATGALGGLMSTAVNTASQAYIAGIYTDAQKYQTDMAYAAAKLGAEASIYNNHNTNSANKAITKMNNDTDLAKANISASATLGSAATYANASMYGAEQSAAAQRYAAGVNAAAQQYAANQHLAGQKYSADQAYASQVYNTEHNFVTNPAGYGKTAAGIIADAASSLYDSTIGRETQRHGNSEITKAHDSGGGAGHTF